jgi:hypothetical protein
MYTHVHTYYVLNSTRTPHNHEHSFARPSRTGDPCQLQEAAGRPFGAYMHYLTSQTHGVDLGNPMYFCHTQGKRHQQNLAKRAAREAAEKQVAPAPQKRAAVKKTGALSLL